MEPERSAWRVFADEWDPERDPALMRGREALHLEPIREPQPFQNGPGRPETAGVAPEATHQADTRRSRISQLLERLRNGDLSAVDTLRNLLDRS